jgi:hypothetical protein
LYQALLFDPIHKDTKITHLSDTTVSILAVV